MGIEIYLRICSALGFAGAALGVSAFFYVLSLINWKQTKLHTSKELNKETCFINQHFFLVVTNFVMGIVCVLICAYELLLIINPIRFKYAKNGYFRGLLYIIVGFIVLGAASVLGIAAGVVNLVSAILTIINTVLIKCGCFGGKAKKSNKSNDEL
ncbi:hypothetical protein M9Y10_011214 [Tritrichomonas musculus]|uniref:Uncharacterized protein n=1 Tax=Tritrichomonas musculus TaxID=1915356 RepID=A0ABR2IL25_9EUKA